MRDRGNGYLFFTGTFWQVEALASLTAFLAVMLCLIRVYNSVSFAEPLQLMTSGDEVSSVFAIWKAKQWMVVYTDRFQPPFNLADFNWLFYQANAVWAGFWLNVLGLDDAWLPTLTRSWTFVGCIAGAVALFILFNGVLRRGGTPNGLLALSLSLLMVFGPLYGFWSFTTRPDVWATSLEIIAVVSFVSLYRTHAMVSVIVASALAYMAWSFKQTTVFGLGGIGLFLLLRGDFMRLAVLSVISILLWTVTILLLSDIYFETLFTIGHPLLFNGDRVVRNLINVALKTSYLWLPMSVFMLVSISKNRKALNFKHDGLFLALCGIVMSLPTSIFMTMQTGSAENYYFTSVFFLSFALVCFLSMMPSLPAGFQNAANQFLKCGFILTSFAVLAVLSGLHGTLKAPGNQELIDTRKACLDTLERPLYVDNRILSLPWMTPGSPSFVRSFYYERERELGRPFGEGGIGGMIDKGKFKTLVIPGKAPPNAVDGSDLRLYQPLPETCGDMTIFVPKQ